MIKDGNASDMEQLGEDDEDDKEWTPRAMHDNESSDSSDEEKSRKCSLDKHRSWRAVDFIACVEEGTEDRCDWTPYMYFKQFFTD